LRDAGRHEDAVAAYGRALRHDPRSPQTLYQRGCALLALERLEAAAADYRSAVELQPDYANAHYNLALVLQRLKRLDEALASYDRALQLKPDDAEAFNNRGTALSELQREEDAVACYEQALARRPGYVEALHNQALSLMTLRRFEEAARSLERLLALDADHPFAEGKLLHANMQCCDWQQGCGARRTHQAGNPGRKGSCGPVRLSGDREERAGPQAMRGDLRAGRLRMAGRAIVAHGTLPAFPDPRRIRVGRVPPARHIGPDGAALRAARPESIRALRFRQRPERRQRNARENRAGVRRVRGYQALDGPPGCIGRAGAQIDLLIDLNGYADSIGPAFSPAARARFT
jgi:tetratricopeptide (TPR) repeat protein